jgi:hypothetical protein
MKPFTSLTHPKRKSLYWTRVEQGKCARCGKERDNETKMCNKCRNLKPPKPRRIPESELMDIPGFFLMEEDEYQEMLRRIQRED